MYVYSKIKLSSMGLNIQAFMKYYVQVNMKTYLFPSADAPPPPRDSGCTPPGWIQGRSPTGGWRPVREKMRSKVKGCIKEDEI